MSGNMGKLYFIDAVDGSEYIVKKYVERTDDEAIEETPKKKRTPFDYLNSAYKKEKYFELIESCESDSNYNQFIINRALSQFYDTLPYAKTLNELGNIPNKLHYNILFSLLPKGTHFGRWHKHDVITDRIKIISKYYCINYNKALEYSRLLTDEEFDIIKNDLIDDENIKNE